MELLQQQKRQKQQLDSRVSQVVPTTVIVIFMGDDE